MRRIVPLLLLALPVRAADPLPGHSFHGEAFDEGPRQAAVIIEGCGKVEFPVTTKNADAQRFFNQGVGQLHGFWYFEAERSFRQVAVLDPECAMAFWGCAMANVNNEKRASAFIKKASGLKTKASKREQMWIDALAEFYRDTKREKKSREMDFIKAVEDIIHENSGDLEAKAFLAWAIWHAKEAGVPMVSREAVDAIISQVFAKEPLHPAHHYRIHLWDDSKPARAVGSAAQCGQAAPAIAHMWHMPGHTFSKVNRLDDAEWQQEAATRVDHAYMIRTQIVPDQIHNYAHNTEWLIRTLEQLGRAHQAASIARNLIEIPRHPVHNKIDNASKSAGFGRTRLLETLLKFEMWDELLALDGSPYLDVTQNPAFEAGRIRAIGIAAFFNHDVPRLQAQIAAAEKLKAAENPKANTQRKRKPEEPKTPGAGAASVAPAYPAEPPAETAPDATAKAKPGAPKKDEPKDKGKTPLESALAELKALNAISANAADAAKLIDQAKDAPKQRTVRYQLAIGNTEKAAELATQLPNDAPGIALRVDVLARAGKDDDAKKHFENARTVAAQLDADLPLSKRLDELATTLGPGKDWRKPAPVRTDSGIRPAIESLGPLAWHPWDAPSFDLEDEHGGRCTLNEYAGKPLIVLFYLGHSCGHCMEQLNAFAGAVNDFAKAGISIVAIGAEARDDLAATRGACRAAPGAPFRLLADPGMKSFREWRCHDDFEGLGLHGAFLVDGRGRVRWADVGHEPFKDVRFLLEESQRLLRFK